MQFKFLLQASGLALLAGTASAQLDTDSLGLNPILGTNPLGGNSKRDLGSMLGGGALGGLMGGQGAASPSSSAAPSSTATPTSSASATPTQAVPQSNKGILGGLGGRDFGGSEADSTIPLNVGSLMGSRDLGAGLIPGNLGSMLGGDSQQGSSSSSITPAPTSGASSSATPTTMQTKVRSTPVENSAKQTGAPAYRRQDDGQEEGEGDDY